MALAVVGSVLMFEWSELGRREVDEHHFELVPVARRTVTPAWAALPVVTTVESRGGEQSLFRLGPMGLIRVEEGTYPDEEERPPEGVRLCDSSSCEESAVALWPGALRRSVDGGIPAGTWRLRHGDADDPWIVSYGAPDDPEHLVVAVLRLPIPLGFRTPPAAMYATFCAALVALASSLVRTVASEVAKRSGKVDVASMCILSAFVVVAAVAIGFGAQARAAPSWELHAVRGGDASADSQNWPLVDIVHGPFASGGTMDDERTARLGFLTLRSRVVLDGMTPREREQDARVCIGESCMGVDPSAQSGDHPASPLFVYGLRHRPGSELWKVTYADDHREHDVGVPWARVRHVEWAERAPWMPWLCLAIAGICFVLEFAIREHRGSR